MKKVFKLLHSKISELFKKIKENGLEGVNIF